MLASEMIRVGIVGVVLAFIYGAAGLILLDGLRRRVSRKPRSDSRAGKWFRRVILTVAGVGIACAGYAYFIEPNWLQVDKVEIKTERLKAGARPIRIVHISDLHCEETLRIEPKVVAAVAALEPDLIVFTGDVINTPMALPVFQACMMQLTQIAPVYAVRGNFDVWFWGDLGLYEGTGVTELDGERKDLIVNGNLVSIIGVPVGKESLAMPLLEAAPDDRPVIFLYHYPDLILDVARTYKATLYCAGHTHGGQVCLPGYGAIMTLSRFGKRFESGLYDVDGTKLYVSRGIGMEASHAPRIRFWCRPEVTLIELFHE